jgi:succinate-acetate transporter protein
MSASPKSFEDCPKMEEAIGSIEREKTRGGHIADLDQPSLPVVHRRFANPAPLGLLSFATGIFLVSCFGVKARGVATPNVLVGVLLFFGGVCQYISGIMEFVAGNTVDIPHPSPLPIPGPALLI